MNQSTADLVRSYFAAYESRDRQVVEDLIAEEGFAFFSPVDDGIDRQTYFQRCFPNDEAREYDFKRLVAIDDEVVVTYELQKTDGSRTRNTEVISFDGAKITTVEVYWGWSIES